MITGWLPHANDAGDWRMHTPSLVRPQATVRGVFGAPQARVVTLTRRSKKAVCSACGRTHSGWYDRKIRRVRELSCGDTRVYLELEIRRVALEPIPSDT